MIDRDKYARACDFLGRLADYEKSAGWKYDSKTLNLARMRLLLGGAGNPQKKYPCIIVAGTKGKGSVSVMLSSIISASGGKPGLYTSPHLVDWTERMKLGGREVSRSQFADLALGLEPLVEGISSRPEGLPTTFEVLTTMALKWFADGGSTSAVLEVGLGGRLDSVNAADSEAECLTSISLDHTAQLGNTIEAISGEKAGVVKSGSPVVCAPQEPAALEVVRKACRSHGAPLYLVGKDITAENVVFSREGVVFTARTPWGVFERLEVRFAGRHQLDNALVAVGCALVLGEKIGTSEAGLREGLRSAVWPGRLQLLDGNPPVLLDGAHNPASGAALAGYLREFYPRARIQLVLGMLQGKDRHGFAREVCPLAEAVFLPLLHHPRAVPVDDMAEAVAGTAPSAVVCGSVAEALEQAKARAAGGGSAPKGRDLAPETGGGLVVVTGSLSLVGEALALSGSI
jgi:dihydrofolate synthase/folylpolyglutamate synthase